MKEQHVAEKVRKLLALAERGGTPEEAANAAAKAQAIIERYNLDRAALDLEPEEKIAFGEPLETDCRLEPWRADLANAVAKANGCRTFSTRVMDEETFKAATRVELVGRPSDVATVRYFYAYLLGEVERLVREAERPPFPKGGVRAWEKAFRFGVVHTLHQRLREARQREADEARKRYCDDGGALVRISQHEGKGDEVDKWLRARVRLVSARPSRRARSDAWAAGQQAGEGVELGAPATGVGAGRLALGGGRGKG